MSALPAVTAVVPTRNRRQLLERTLTSVLRQEGVTVRVVVVDDGSTDDTRRYLSTLSPDRMHTVHLDGKGAAAARNAGIDAATTPFVAFCDDDDRWAPGKLAGQLAAMARTGARWSCTGTVFVDPSDQVIGHQRASDGDVLEQLLEHNAVSGSASSVVTERSLLHETGGFDPEMHGAEDWEMWVRLAERSPIAGVDGPLVAYLVSDANASRDVAWLDAARATFLATYGDRVADPARAQLAYDRYIARIELRRGRRVASARRHAGVAWRDRTPRELVQAVEALLSPRRAERRRARRDREQVPVPWRIEAEAWLAELDRAVAVALDQR